MSNQLFQGEEIVLVVALLAVLSVFILRMVRSNKPDPKMALLLALMTLSRGASPLLNWIMW